MQWVFQSTGVPDSFTRDMFEEVKKQGYEHKTIGIIPFTDTITGIEEINPEIPTFFYGSTRLIELLQSHPVWKRGIFHNSKFDIFTTDVPRPHDNFLNSHPTRVSLQEIFVNWNRHFSSTDDPKFIRPVSSLKFFAGQVVNSKNHGEVREILEAVLVNHPHVSVAVSLYQEIWAEWRFFIVDGEVVTGSMYRNSGRLEMHRALEDMLLIAQAMTDRWLPHWTCVMDLALTTKGIKVIEYNSINSSGLYACDISKIVKSISELVTETWNDSVE